METLFHALVECDHARMEYGKGSLWPESAETLQHGRKISLITRWSARGMLQWRSQLCGQFGGEQE